MTTLIRRSALCRLSMAIACAIGIGSAVVAEGPSLADAVERQDRTAIRALLEGRADVNAGQVDGTTALHWAAYHDDLEIATQLVRGRANVNAVTRYGVTPLSLACTNGSAPIVELLLGAGADPDAALPGGETPLMIASRTGRIGVVKALLARGARVDAGDERRGQTALMWAAAEGHAEVVRTLIDAGADFRARLASGFTPLLFAVRQGHVPVVDVLLKAGADVNEPIPVEKGRRGYGGRMPPTGATPLLMAVSNAHFELAAHLLDGGANPDADLPGYTVLHAISAVRNPGIGDNDPAPDGSGMLSSLALVKQLVAHGADVNARMTKRPNLNNTRLNELGATPFLLASLTADVELMRTLADLGADPSLTNADGSTPLLVTAGLATRSPGEDAGTEAEVLRALQLLLDLGADINAVDRNGETVMHAAAYKNLPDVVKFLASKGARIELWNQENRFGWTPLAIATGYRFGNFKPSPPTVAALRDVMIAGGVKPPETVTGTNRLD